MSYTWENIKKEFLLYEDDAVLAINKPAGISVVGDSNIDLVTLAQKDDIQLSPAHRIDKETSGVILFAKTPQVHACLTRQFNRRTINKAYLATVSHGLPEQGRIELPLSVGRKKQVRVATQRTNITFDKKKNLWTVAPSAVFTHTKTYPSTTIFTKVLENNKHTLLIVKPITGRRHQIRIHFAWIGHPIAGDPLFEKEKNKYTCMLLHSWRIGFTADWSNSNRITLEATPSEDFWKSFKLHSPSELLERAQKVILNY